MAKNYKRFYALLKQHPAADKDSLVMEFTGERTTSLREMTDREFASLCDALQYGAGQEYTRSGMTELKAARSAALLRMGRLGINTVDNWDGIDQFCLSGKIAGKRFAQLTVGELRDLTAKLEMIRRRGGLKARTETRQPVMQYYIKGNSKYLN